MSQQLHQEHIPEGDQSHSIKTFLLRKTFIYLDNIIGNALFVFVFGGAFWIVQRIWGLRLIPFSVLDAVLLSIGLVIIIIMLSSLLLYLYLRKHPELLAGLAIGLFAAWLGVSFFTSVTQKREDEKKKHTSQEASVNKEEDRKVKALRECLVVPTKAEP